MKRKRRFTILTVILLITVIILPVLFFSGCPSLESKKRETPLARVNDHYFYPSDLPDLVRNSISSKDSAEIASTYIKKWVKNKLLLEKAELNIPDETQQEVLKKLQDTRASLMIYEYQQQMIKQKMDTVVAQSEIDDYYNKFANNFILNKNIVKALFIQLPLNTPNIENARKWYRSNQSEDLTNLEGYCYQYATKYDYFNEDWIPFNSLLNLLPVSVNNKESYLKYNQFIETTDTASRYFANIRDYRLRGSPAPVEYIRDNIRNIILNNRKTKFLKEIENNIYYDALSNNKIEIYK